MLHISGIDLSGFGNNRGPYSRVKNIGGFASRDCTIDSVGNPLSDKLSNG